MGTGTRLPSERDAIDYSDRRLTEPIKNGQRKRAKATTNLNPPHRTLARNPDTPARLTHTPTEPLQDRENCQRIRSRRPPPLPIRSRNCRSTAASTSALV